LLLRFWRSLDFLCHVRERYAIRRDSKFARAWTCSEFAAGVQRWHGRIAIVSGWLFDFKFIESLGLLLVF
jgi:hypothetical protein